MKIVQFLLFALLLGACASENQADDPFVAALETAHHKQDFVKHEAVQFDFLLHFGGRERLNATMTLTTDGTKGLIATKSGDSIFFMHDTVYHNPGYENAKSVRFAAYTWSYFFMLPYKLNDPGTQWSEEKSREHNTQAMRTKKLTFESGTGDAPDDWYIIYQDPEKALMRLAAYIVTSGKSVEEAEEDPHAIEYLEYTDVDGVPLATAWKFWAWRADSGVTKLLGDATLSNIQFVEEDQLEFAPPAHYLRK